MTAAAQATDPRVRQAIRLRRMTEADLAHTLAWRNDERSRRWFKTSAPLTPDSHVAWFRARENDPADRMYIAERLADACAVAQVAIYRIDAVRRDAEVGRFLTDPELRGRGYFAQALEALLAIARGELALADVYLEALQDNARALAIYRRAGFGETSRQDGLVRMELSLA